MKIIQLPRVSPTKVFTPFSSSHLIVCDESYNFALSLAKIEYNMLQSFGHMAYVNGIYF